MEGGVQVLPRARPVALANVDCDGTEASLLECSSDDSKVPECGLSGTKAPDNIILACGNTSPSAPPRRPDPDTHTRESRLLACNKLHARVETRATEFCNTERQDS